MSQIVDQHGNPAGHKKKANPIEKFVYFLGFRHSDPNNPESQSKQGQTKEDRQYAIESTAYRLARTGTILAIIGAVIYFFQLKANRKQADFSELQLKEMHKQIILDERAWVNVFRIARTDFANPAVRFEAYFKNTGKTPAINQRANMGVTNNISSISFDIHPPNSSQQLLPPDVESHVEFVFPIPEAERADILSGKELIYVYGGIWYDDIFTNQHWSQFCWVVDAKENRIYPAMTNNACDDAEAGQK